MDVELVNYFQCLGKIWLAWDLNSSLLHTRHTH